MSSAPRRFGRLRSAASIVLVCGLAACDRDTTDEPEGSRASGDPFAVDQPPTLVDGFFDGGTFPPGFIGPPGFGGGILPPRLATVQTASVKPPPIFGGTLSVSPDEKYLVAADPDRDNVQVIERATNAVRTISLPAGSRPFRAQIAKDGMAYVVLRGAGKLLRISLADAQTTELAVCAEPRGVALDSAGSSFGVACASGELVTVGVASFAVGVRTQTDADLRDVVPRAAGGFHLSRFRSAELVQVNAEGRALGRNKGLGASTFFEQPLLDGVMPVRPSAAAWRTVALADGKIAMLHQNSQDTPVTEQPGGYGGAGCPITTGGLTVFGADGRPESYAGLQLFGANVDVSISPKNGWLAVASPGGYGTGGATLGLYSAQPQPASDGSAAPITCSNFPAVLQGQDVQITSVAFGASGNLYALSREPATLSEYSIIDASLEVVLRQRIVLSDTSVRDTGHDLFHSDTGVGLACVSCHGEAEDDGHVWNFDPSGPRRTQHLRGGVLGRAPFHWAGDLGNMQTLMDVVMTGRMSGFGMDASHTQALGTWLDAQPALLPSAPDAASVARGKALFESTSVACASCHAGADLSSNAPVDVGTGGLFKVPTLRGIALRPPYMHDGCAATLHERFEPNCGGSKHGDTSKLSSAEIDDLVAYLSSL